MLLRAGLYSLSLSLDQWLSDGGVLCPQEMFGDSGDIMIVTAEGQEFAMGI